MRADQRGLKLNINWWFCY